MQNFCERRFRSDAAVGALLNLLKTITPEEQALLEGHEQLQRGIYMDSGSDVIDAKRLLDSGRLIALRPHTRFVHFPEHSHNYVEMVYMCCGKSTHIANGKTIVLHQGELLLFGQGANTDHGTINKGWDQKPQLVPLIRLVKYERTKLAPIYPLTDEEYKAYTTGTAASESRTHKNGMLDTIAMAFDECVENPAEYSYSKHSCERTTRWLKRCKAKMAELNSLENTVSRARCRTRYRRR